MNYICKRPRENVKICPSPILWIWYKKSKNRFSCSYKTKKFCWYRHFEYRLGNVYPYINVRRHPGYKGIHQVLSAVQGF